MSLFSLKGAHTGAFISAGVILMPAFLSWLPIFSIYLEFTIFETITSAIFASNWLWAQSYFRTGDNLGRQDRQSMIAETLFIEEASKKKKISASLKKITGYNKSLPVLQSTDAILLFSGLVYP